MTKNHTESDGGHNGNAFDLAAHLHRQREWSDRTFGPGPRAAGIVDHIRKELREIEADPGDLREWIDVAILALDGAWRSGASPEQIIDALVTKQTKNEGRVWPDWRTMPADKAIEHDRSAETEKAKRCSELMSERPKGGSDAQSGHTKILADGTRLPAGSDRTDHEAVIDHATGLMWAVKSTGGVSQGVCEQRCRAMTLLGFDDWHLPTRAELAALVDDSWHVPAIDTNLFPGVLPRWHWTSTPTFWAISSAWGVDFYDGSVDGFLLAATGYALAVRRVTEGEL